MENQPVIEGALPKKNFLPFVIAVVAVLLCCCLVAGLAGAWVYLSNPGENAATSSYNGLADTELRTDTLKLIESQESTSGCNDITLISAEVLNPPQAEAGGVWTEMWQIGACSESHLYAVTFSPDPAGGTNIYALRADQ